MRAQSTVKKSHVREILEGKEVIDMVVKVLWFKNNAALPLSASFIMTE